MSYRDEMLNIIDNPIEDGEWVDGMARLAMMEQETEEQELMNVNVKHNSEAFSDRMS